MNKKDIAQEKINNWNSKYPIGTPVIRYKLINPLEEGKETKSRSEAFISDSGNAAIFVEGVSGYVLLGSIVPISN